nr:substrate-binding domain-containing protein [Frondihabitans sp. 762G35]
MGLVVSSVANPFASTLHRGVEDAAALNGVAVFSASGDDDPAREQAIVSALVRRRVDGLVITSTAADHGYLVKEQERGTPIVFVDRRPTGLDVDAVVCDNAEGAAAAVRHLFEAGHRRIAYLGDRNDIRTALERRDGFLEAMGQGGVPLNEIVVVEDLHDEEVAQAAVEAVLRLPEPPTALFTSQNLVTVGAIRALRRLGLQHEIALVGFDDVLMADLLEPAVTVISQDPHRIGELATERLFARLAGDRSAPQTLVVPTRLIARGSGEIPPRG